MLVLLTNDDGYGADGLKALEKAFANIEHVVVAPKFEQSECGHRVTTKTDISVEQLAKNHFVVDGTPADCVRIALMELFPEITHVVSGINSGANLGADQYISGTVAAAREGTYQNRQCYAVSQYIVKNIPLHWNEVAQSFFNFFSESLKGTLPEHSFYNINYPCLNEGIKHSKWINANPDRSPLPVSYESSGNSYRYNGVFSERKKVVESDIDVCFGGNISVSTIQI